jgi:hypothetical protein
MRRRSSVSVPWTPILWVLIAGTVITGVLFSPMTALTEVRTVNLDPKDKPFVSQVVSGFKDRPALQINRANVESLILQNSAFDQCQFDVNPFGRGVISVTYRQPVAKFSGIPFMFLADDGSSFRRELDDDGLPLLQVPESVRTAEATIASRIPWAALAYLAAELRDMASGEPATIRFVETGRVSLGLDGAEVKLGMAVDLDRKMTNLRKMREADPSLLKRVRYLNLIAPDKPAALYKRNQRTPASSVQQ